MNKGEGYFGNWYVSYDADDGARIKSLKYAGHDLLTGEPLVFRAPQKSFGEYETRPVFGYDDCFPTVDQCFYPGNLFKCRDHGELCWQKWTVEKSDNKLVFSTDCLKPEVKFTRSMEFAGSRLTWTYNVTNVTNQIAPFLHVMHALLPVKEIQSVVLPGHRRVFDEIHQVNLKCKNQEELAHELLGMDQGKFRMLLLRDLDSNSLGIKFRNGISLNIIFDKDLIPTLGIWWNKGGYPNEEGLERMECAFEPIPGSCSDLSKSFSDGIFLEVKPGETFAWKVEWNAEKH